MRLDEPRGHEKILRRQFLLLMATLSDFTQKKSSYPSTTKLTESMAIQFISFANFTKLIKSDGLKILLMLFSRAVVVALVYRSAGHGFVFRQMKTYM